MGAVRAQGPGFKIQLLIRYKCKTGFITETYLLNNRIRYKNVFSLLFQIL